MNLIITVDGSHGIYIGGKDDAKNKTALKQHGVTHILNMTPEKDSSIQSGIPNYFEKKRLFTYKRVPVYDTSSTNLLDYAPMIVAFIANGLHYGSVFVHCQRGVSRSATAVLFYLMSKQGMKYEDALALVQRKRSFVNPIESFRSQLLTYEGHCKEKGLIKDNQNDKRKDDKGKEGKGKKRKAIGPSIGPQKMVKSETNGSIESQPKKESRASNNDEKIKSSKDNSEKRSIGPTLPPGFKRG